MSARPSVVRDLAEAAVIGAPTRVGVLTPTAATLEAGVAVARAIVTTAATIAGLAAAMEAMATGAPGAGARSGWTGAISVP